MNIEVMFSRKSDNWSTPSKLYYHYMINKYFDPCPLYSNFNGLEIEWKEKNFVNPPYSKIKEFVNKSIEEHKKGKEVILLIPARTDTKYFRKLVDYGSTIIFITGHYRFYKNDYEYIDFEDYHNLKSIVIPETRYLVLESLFGFSCIFRYYTL